MSVIVVANPKGGVGKSTLSTNLAGYFANQGHSVMLGDVDKQQSSRHWLEMRPASVAPILSWEIDANHIAKPPKGTTHIVLDTPAGLHGKRLNEVMKIARKIIVPLQPSMFDILATQDFLRKLSEEPQIRNGEVKLGLVGMRFDARTQAAEQLQRFIAEFKLPMIAYLRDTQNYVKLAAHGLTLWDVAPSRTEKDRAQWEAIISWVES